MILDKYCNIGKILHFRRTPKISSIFLSIVGTGEAGKSTFLKTLQIGYGDGISDDEKRKKIKLVHQNIVLGKD